MGFLWELPEPIPLWSARKWCVIENMQVPGNVYWTISLKRAETTEKYQIPYHSVNYSMKDLIVSYMYKFESLAVGSGTFSDKFHFDYEHDSSFTSIERVSLQIITF